MSAGNPIQGEAPLVLGGVRHTLIYDWRALAVMEDAVGPSANLFDPQTLAATLVIGLERHHGGISLDVIYDASPPLAVAVAAFNQAMKLSYFGHRAPPQDKGDPVPQQDRLEQISTAYVTAFRIGIQPSEFWRLTPFQTNLLVQANAEKEKDDFEKLISASWHTAVFSRCKTMPPLKSLFRKEHDPTLVLDGDDEDQIQAKQMIAAMMGATKVKSIETAKGS